LGKKQLYSLSTMVLVLSSNAVAKGVCNPVIPPASTPFTTFCFVCFYRPAFCRLCVCSNYGLHICSWTNK